jgi:rubrerythrin
MEASLSQPELKPILIKDILLLSPGRWNDVDYTELEIQKAFNSTDWNDRKYRTLYLDHQDTKERGVANFAGFIQNQRLVGSSLFGDLEVWNPMIGAYLQQAKAKFGISATLAGRENKNLGRMEDFHFESFSIVTDPACKPAMINLANKQINMVANSDVKVVTMDNETKEDITELESVKHKERREGSEGVLSTKDFAGALKAMKADEKKAPGDYENLKSLTEHEECKKKIDGIIADERRHYEILSEMETKHELAEGTTTSTTSGGSEVRGAYGTEPSEIDKKKKKDEELSAKFERQVSHIKDSLKKTHPDWDAKKIESVAYAAANKMKENKEELSELLSSEKIQAWSDAIVLTDKSDSDTSSRKENSDLKSLKGGIKMPEIMENTSVKVEELATPVKVVDAIPKIEGPGIHDTNVDGHSIFVKQEGKELEAKKDVDKDKKEKDDEKDDKEEMSSDAILNKVKEMSADELVKFTEFTKAHLNANKEASAKEVYLAFEKSKKDKKSEKELSANDLLASIDSRIASLKELDSSKKIQEMETKIQELSAKVKTPDRKTLSVAFSNAADATSGMLNFLQHRIN